MKTEEDEAFDDLARKQGDWGGGFQAKKAMAKARIEEDDDIQDYKRPWVGLTDQESIDIIKKDNNYKYPIQLLQAVMDALKEKNT
jgi:peptidoglycan/xylan/chitin deacetylase (PgdA/CDA1 family)